MYRKKYSFEYAQYPIGQLSCVEQDLIREARNACKTAYAPYSNFQVGVAVLLDSGEVLTASNQESEVFPSGMCAERSLLYYVQANRPQHPIRTLVIVSVPDATICTPCGACRQVIADTEKRQQTPIKLILCGATEALVVESARLLLPFTFELH